MVYDEFKLRGSNMQIPVQGAILNVEVDGPANVPSVLMWHGAWCTARMWALVVDQLKDDFRLIRLDVRGVGHSTPTEDPDSQYTFEQYAADANIILDTLAIKRTHVWSMAWGSRAALAYCALNPDRVSSAVFNDASIGAADVDAQRTGAKLAVEKQIAAGTAKFARPDGWNEHAHPDAVQPALAAAGKFDLPGAVDKLTMPVLVATGDHDPNLESSRELVDKAPNARLTIFENVGHGSVLQRPDLTAAAFVEFHKSLSSG
jgi:pimeloyl-ACP methyl ester carboxylesterase